MSGPDSAAASALTAAPDDDDDDGDVQFLNRGKCQEQQLVTSFHSIHAAATIWPITRRLGQSAGWCRHVALNRLLSKIFCLIFEAEKHEAQIFGSFLSS